MKIKSVVIKRGNHKRIVFFFTLPINETIKREGVRKVETIKMEDIKNKSLSFYQAGRPNLFMEGRNGEYDIEKEQEIMNKYPDVPFYQIQLKTATDHKDIIQTHKNKAFDFEYVKTRGNQSTVIMDSMKTIMHSTQLASMNKELRKGEFSLVKDLMNMMLPLYRDLYQDNETGLFAVPSIIENDDRQYSFGISAIVKWADGDIQYLNTLIMDEIGFVEETDPGVPWLLIDGVLEQKDMPEELKELFHQINVEHQNDITVCNEYIQ